MRIEGRGKRWVIYALAALAERKAFNIWKFVKRICPIITDGKYTPAAVRAAPKEAPARMPLMVLPISLLLVVMIPMPKSG